MDYLPIQASAVPCERVFSSAGETNTKRRNRLKPDLVEALQMLKFLLKKRRLRFSDHWMVTEEELTVDSEESGRLDNLLSAGAEGRPAVLEDLVIDV
jgi:hypothetical protein